MNSNDSCQNTDLAGIINFKGMLTRQLKFFNGILPGFHQPNLMIGLVNLNLQ